MGKKKKQGHYCRHCHRFRANEKFSGKGHRQHICKDCNKELQAKKRARKRANKLAVAAGLRPLKKAYPKTVKQIASYLQISLNQVEDACEQFQIEHCDVTDSMHHPLPLYDIDAILAIATFIDLIPAE